MDIDTIRCILEGQLPSTRMRDLDSDKAAFSELIGLLSLHPVWSARLDEIEGIRVSRPRLNGAMAMHISITPKKAPKTKPKPGAKPWRRRWFMIGWRDCRERKRAPRVGVKTTEQKRLTSAMRHAVRVQIAHWENNHMFSAKCVNCKSTENLQVDHADPPFSHIARDFLSSHSECPTEFGMNRSCQSVFRQNDRAFARAWQAYHKQRATYQWLCQPCNGSKGNKIPSADYGPGQRLGS